MPNRAYPSVVFACLVVLGCRATNELPAESGPVSTATAVAPGSDTPVSSSSVATAPILATTGNERVLPPNGHPPKLQPVLSKPFPDGASDEQVCAAVANTGETDLWLRFGYLVPMYIHGSILIVEATDKDVKRIEDLVHHYHRGIYWPSIKRCSTGKVLLYIRQLTDGTPQMPRGHRHLAGLIQRELGLNVTESFGFPYDYERRSDYCREDAELCEQLVKLDYANQGKGMCSEVIISAGTDASEDKHLERCRRLPAKTKACVYVDWSRNERDQRIQCECGIREGLGLRRMRSECGRLR